MAFDFDSGVKVCLHPLRILFESLFGITAEIDTVEFIINVLQGGSRWSDGGDAAA
jgi:hypothetical protein